MIEKWYRDNEALKKHMLWSKNRNAAKPGQIYTLTGDLGVGKTVFTQGWQQDLGLQNR